MTILAVEMKRIGRLIHTIRSSDSYFGLFNQELWISPALWSANLAASGPTIS